MKKFYAFLIAAATSMSMMAQCVLYESAAEETIDATGTGTVWGASREISTGAPVSRVDFTAWRTGFMASGSFRISVSKDGQDWRELDKIAGSISSNPAAFSRDLQEDDRYVRFGKNGIGAEHVSNISVTQKQYLRNASVDTLAFDTTEVGSPAEPLTFTVDFSAIGTELPISLESDVFSFDVLDGPEENCEYGTATISVTYTPTAVGTDSAILSIGDTIQVQLVGIAKVAPVVPTSLSETNIQKTATKLFRNGQIFILREEQLFDLRGRRVK